MWISKFFSVISITVLCCLCVNGYTIVKVTEPVEHGDTPVWDERTNRLLFVDRYNGVYSYSPEIQKLNHLNLAGTVAPVVPSSSSSSRFIIGLNRTVSALTWDQESENYSIEQLTTLSENYTGSSTNDGKADTKGRLYLGTVGDTKEGALYLVTDENLKNPEEVISSVTVSNGPVWNKANDKLYFIDKSTRQISVYNYNVDTGGITFNRTLFNFNDYYIYGDPNGFTIDENDNLWIALYYGSMVVQINSATGEFLNNIQLPVGQITSCTFGGENLDILYLTTSKLDLTSIQLEQQPLAGSVLAITDLGVKGLPANKVNL